MLVLERRSESRSALYSFGYIASWRMALHGGNAFTSRIFNFFSSPDGVCCSLDESIRSNGASQHDKR